MRHEQMLERATRACACDRHARRSRIPLTRAVSLPGIARCAQASFGMPARAPGQGSGSRRVTQGRERVFSGLRSVPHRTSFRIKVSSPVYNLRATVMGVVKGRPRARKCWTETPCSFEYASVQMSKTELSRPPRQASSPTSHLHQHRPNRNSPAEIRPWLLCAHTRAPHSQRPIARTAHWTHLIRLIPFGDSHPVEQAETDASPEAKPGSHVSERTSSTLNLKPRRPGGSRCTSNKPQNLRPRHPPDPKAESCTDQVTAEQSPQSTGFDTRQR